MLFTCTTICVIIVGLAILGYIISRVFKVENSNLINVNKATSKFIGKESWISMLAPIYGLTLHIYNVFLWAIFSVHQILKAIAFVFSLIAQLFKLIIEAIKWIWNEIIDPTIVFVLKLIWHYGVKFIWKFFVLAISFITPSYSQQNLNFTIKNLLKLTSVLALGFIITSLFDWFAYVAITASFIYLIYILNIISVRLNIPEEGENMALRLSRKNIFWYGLAGTALAILYGLQSHSQSDFISNLAFPSTELLLPVGLIFLFASLFAGKFLIAYDHYEKGGTGVLDFIKSILKRILKIFYSSPFAGAALIIVSILPTVLYTLINWGVNEYSGKDVVEHYADVVQMIGIDNNYRKLGEDIDANESRIIKLDSTFIADSTSIASKISSKQEEIAALKETEVNLLKESIFTQNGEFYVSENQVFSFPPYSNSESITWLVLNGDNKEIRKLTKGSETESSNLFNYTWNEGGNYTVEAYFDNSCDTSNKFSREVEVKDLASYTRIGSIDGSEQICSGDEVSFSIGQNNLDQYEWNVPNDATILEGSQTNKIKVKWGNSSGLVSVRGKEKDREFSSRSYIAVYVPPTLGSSDPSNKITIPEDLISSELPDRPFVFYDIADVRDAIYSVTNEIEELKAEIVNISAEHKASVNSLESENAIISSQRTDLIVRWFSLTLSILGLVILISILLAPVIIYSSLFNFSIYNYEEEGPHYISEKLSAYKNRNPQQPLFGWFMLGVTLILISLLTTGTLLGFSSSSMFQSESQPDFNYSDFGTQSLDLIEDSAYAATMMNEQSLNNEEFSDYEEETYDQGDQFDLIDLFIDLFDNDEDSEGIEELENDLIDSTNEILSASQEVYRIQLLSGDLKDCEREMSRIELNNELNLECLSTEENKVRLLIAEVFYSIEDACAMLNKAREYKSGAFIVSQNRDTGNVSATNLGENC